mmetsp:Transcript_49814/g.98184  ORF Transcript_49814/g.98184 Transcript_49814/m.98184 type:complete len:223 (-) Transcript_49814:32-700(-)
MGFLDLRNVLNFQLFGIQQRGKVNTQKLQAASVEIDFVPCKDQVGHRDTSCQVWGIAACAFCYDSSRLNNNEVWHYNVNDLIELEYHILGRAALLGFFQCHGAIDQKFSTPDFRNEQALRSAEGLRRTICLTFITFFRCKVYFAVPALPSLPSEKASLFIASQTSQLEAFKFEQLRGVCCVDSENTYGCATHCQVNEGSHGLKTICQTTSLTKDFDSKLDGL